MRGRPIPEGLGESNWHVILPEIEVVLRGESPSFGSTLWDASEGERLAQTNYLSDRLFGRVGFFPLVTDVTAHMEAEHATTGP